MQTLILQVPILNFSSNEKVGMTWDEHDLVFIFSYTKWTTSIKAVM